MLSLALQVAPVDAERMATALGAASYVECSAKDNIGLRQHSDATFPFCEIGVDQLFTMIAESAVKLSREPVLPAPPPLHLLMGPSAASGVGTENAATVPILAPPGQVIFSLLSFSSVASHDVFRVLLNL